MYKKLLPLLVLLFSGKALAFEFPIEVTEYFDDVKIVAYIDKSDINEVSHWIPFEKQPPLSIYDALQAVKKFMISNSVFGDATVTGIELRRIPHHEIYWHYVVKVKYKDKENIRPHFFVVLMDGKVISAIREPESIK